MTSDFHAERARLIFEREFPKIPITLSPSRTNLPEEDLLKLKVHEKRRWQALKRQKNEVLL